LQIRLVSAPITCLQRLRLITPFSPPLPCASRIFLLGRYRNLLSTSLSYRSSIKRHLRSLHLLWSHLHNTYDQCVKIYTDGPKTSSLADCGIYIGDKNLKYSIAINKFSSSITSALFAILHALYLVCSLKIVKVVIVTDRLSPLQSITNWNWKKHCFSNKITLLCSTLPASGYEIRFLWVPGHKNILGNEMADELVKLSTAETSLSPPQGVHYKHVTTRLF